MERDAGGTGDPPVPVGATNGAQQTNPIARDAVASHWVDWIVCGWASGVICRYPGSDRARNNGPRVGKYTHWTVVVARIVAPTNFTVLAS